MTSGKNLTYEILSVRNIAAWQFERYDDPKDFFKIVAALPPIQRGQVWKAKQIEEFWDSLVRGFPVGSFLTTRIRNDNKQSKRDLAYGSNSRSNHFLLDGQQRANAIALGHFNPWREEEEEKENPPAILWVDLEVPDATDGREYLFRVLTRAHPWGYPKEGKEANRLTLGQRRDAFSAYSACQPDLENKSVYDIPLRYFWPWESLAPIPVPFLIQAIDECGANADAVRENLRRRLANLPFWNSANNRQGEKLQAAVETKLGTDPADYCRFNALINRMAATVHGTKESFPIPVLVLSKNTVEGEEEDAEEEDAASQKPPALETLFIRVNKNGTEIGSEELIYSILKSIWPDAYKAVERINCRFVTPARLVVLVARLILARDEYGKENSESQPPTLKVARFRRFMRDKKDGKANEAKLKEFIENCFEGSRVFRIAEGLLTGCYDKEGYTLPSVLVSDIAQRSPDVFFLLLVWIDRMLEDGVDPIEAMRDDHRHRQVLGTLTAISWFAKDQAKCVRILWQELVDCGEEFLPDFFSRKLFIKLLSLGEYGKPNLLPVFSPTAIAKAIRERIFEYEMGDVSKSISDPQNALWRDWRWNQNFAGELPRSITKGKNVEALFRTWYPDQVTRAEQLELKITEAWGLFIERLRRNTRVLLYAQRKWIKTWWEFRPEDLDELERPWDFDHIHAKNYVYDKRAIPQIIRDWHETIGNLRAWPFAMNRSDGDGLPHVKFVDSPGSDEFHRYENRYGVECLEEKLAASVIDRGCLQHWLQSVPDDCSDLSYLANPANGEHREHLILAITSRFVELYCIWYEELELDQLMPSAE